MHGGSAVTWTAIRRNKIRRKGKNLLFHAMPVVIEEIASEGTHKLLRSSQQTVRRGVRGKLRLSSLHLNSRCSLRS